MPQKIHNKKPLQPNRKTLRNNSTIAEAVLWTHIQRGKLDGRKFRRQHSLGSYILDFYCPTERLCIELDGAGHYTLAGTLRDEERTNYINSLNIRVIRFENKLVFKQLEYVLAEIKSHFAQPQ